MPLGNEKPNPGQSLGKTDQMVGRGAATSGRKSSRFSERKVHGRRKPRSSLESTKT